MMKRFIRSLLALLIFVSALLVPRSTAKYVSAAAEKTAVAVWSNPITLLGVNCNTDSGNNLLRVARLTVTANENEGWYAFILIGGDGGAAGGANTWGMGPGGVAKGVVWLDPGIYYLVAGAAGSNGTGGYNSRYGGAKGNGNGGGGGGLSGIFKYNDAAYNGALSGTYNTAPFVRGPAPTLTAGTNTTDGTVKTATNYATQMAAAAADAGNKVIAIAGGGGGGGPYRGGGSNQGGCGGGYVTGGFTTTGIEPGDSARDNNNDYGTTYAGNADYERGAGGGRYQLRTKTWHGGGAYNADGTGNAQAGETNAIFMGGDGRTTGYGGGGGGGYYGGGGGSNCSVAGKDGGGGGGASYIITGNAGHASLAFAGTTDKAVAPGNTHTNAGDSHGFGTPLRTEIANYLNRLPVPRQRLNNQSVSGLDRNTYSGIVVLAYLGPTDPTTDSFVYNWTV